MQYLVTCDYVEPGPLLPPDQLAAMLRQLVLPSHDALVDFKAKEKLLAGGYSVGQRARAFIFEADSNEDLDAMLQVPPYWRLTKFRGTPLESVEGRWERDRQQDEQIEQRVSITGSAPDRDERGRG